MQPYVNPYLFANQFPGIQPGMNYQNNNYLQQAQGMAGKYVNDFSEITANDVPMGGQPAIFVRNDRNEIQLREWSPNGQILSTLYRPYKEEPQQAIEQSSQPSFDVKAELLDPIFDKLSELEQQLAKLSKPTTKKVAE